ncbi:hypothetical protein [Krasilnikovia sp. MM14-A1259]|uniref:hypothetical protein n=1 Tax=Krasilnikovia sp. MM14-A1259 TaxID=3373539 RepID=UPI0038171F20
MGRLAPNVSGDLVRVALREAHPAGLTLRQLVAATQLTPAQVSTGLRFLRDTLAALGLPPLVWSRRDGYRHTDDPAVLVAYERAFIRTELTRIARLLSGTVIPHAQRLPDDEWAELILGQLTGVKSALSLLVRVGQ